MAGNQTGRPPAMANDDRSDGASFVKSVDDILGRTERVFLHNLRSAVGGAAARDRNLYQQIASYVDLRAIVGAEAEIPPLRGFAISPDMGVFLVRLLERLRPASILELGSGFSSVLLGRYCARHGGRVTSLDHDEDYRRKSAALIEGWDLGRDVDILLSLIETHDAGEGRSFPFCGPEPLGATGRTFGFLFIDGPPISFGPTVRGGFLPLFGRFLRPGCHILLDDYYRKGEQEVVSAWVEAGLVETVEIRTELEKHAALLVYRGEAP